MSPPDAPDPTPANRSRGLVLLLLCAVFMAHAMSFSGWFIDDAFITMRYGQQLASGNGVVFNVGQRVEGYTDFTWVLLSALSLRLGVEPTLSLPLVGLACGLLTVAMVFRAGGRLAPPSDVGRAWGGTAAAAVVATTTAGAVYAVTGLETTLFTALATAAAVALVEGRPARFAAWTATAFLTRPEAGLLGVFGVAWIASRCLRRRAPWRDLATAVGVLAALVLPYVAWKLAYFGSIIPNTLRAKSPDRAAGWSYVWPVLVAAAGLSAAAIASLRVESRRRRTGAFAALWLSWMLAVWWEGGDWMPSVRLVAPGVPFLALAADAELVDWALAPRRRAARATLAAAALALWCAWNIREHRLAREHFVTTEPAVAPLLRLTHALEALGATSAALVDIGEVGYRTRWRILDMAGLVDPVIARTPGPHGDKHFPIAHFAAMHPDVAIFRADSPPKADSAREGAVMIPAIWSVETWVSASAWFRSHYRYVCTQPITRHFMFVVMERADRPPVARPPLGAVGCLPLLVRPRPPRAP